MAIKNRKNMVFGRSKTHFERSENLNTHYPPKTETEHPFMANHKCSVDRKSNFGRSDISAPFLPLKNQNRRGFRG